MFNTLGELDNLGFDIRGGGLDWYTGRIKESIAPGPSQPRTELQQYNPAATPCDAGYFRPTAYSECVADPQWRSGPAPLEANAPGVIRAPVPAPLVTAPAPASSGGGIGGLFGGMDTTTLLLIGAGAFFLMKRRYANEATLRQVQMPRP
jgi:hypothetical protein